MVTLKNSYLRLYNAFCGCVFTETINLYPIFDDYNFQMDDVNGTNVMVITADVISGGAEDDRLLSTRGTFKLENLQEMPCSCEVCTKYTPDDLRAMPKEQRRELIAQHNLHVSFAELRLIRQAIYDGNLMERVEERCLERTPRTM